MISEVAFARDHGSFWRVATPMMDGFVRQLNGGLYERDFQPIKAGAAASRRALINEVAFEAFCMAIGARQTGNRIVAVSDLLSEALLPVRDQAILHRWEGDYEPILSEEETSDALEQVRRLGLRVRRIGDLSDIVCKPAFPGCGIVDNCFGDVLIRSTLSEIKAGDRPFRAIDIRQVLTYLALNYRSGRFQIDRVLVFNPRLGLSLEIAVEDLCYELSGVAPSQLLDTICYGISSGDLSR